MYNVELFLIMECRTIHSLGYYVEYCGGQVETDIVRLEVRGPFIHVK